MLLSVTFGACFVWVCGSSLWELIWSEFACVLRRYWTVNFNISKI